MAQVFELIPIKIFSSSVKRWGLLLKTSCRKTQKFCWYLVALARQFFEDSITCQTFFHKYLKMSISSISLLQFDTTLWQLIWIGTMSREHFGTEVIHPCKKSNRSHDEDHNSVLTNFNMKKGGLCMSIVKTTGMVIAQRVQIMKYK